MYAISQWSCYFFLCNSNYQQGISDYLERKDIILNSYMKMQSIKIVKRSVMNNLEITYSPISAIREELKNDSPVQIKTKINERMYTSVCVYHKKMDKSTNEVNIAII